MLPSAFSGSEAELAMLRQGGAEEGPSGSLDAELRIPSSADGRASSGV